jgi:hypothetical protein
MFAGRFGVVGDRRLRRQERKRRHRRFMAQAQGHNGRFGVYFTPWAVSDGASQWLGGFSTVEEAMVAAGRYVAASSTAQATRESRQRDAAPLLAPGLHGHTRPPRANGQRVVTRSECRRSQ